MAYYKLSNNISACIICSYVND